MAVRFNRRASFRPFHSSILAASLAAPLAAAGVAEAAPSFTAFESGQVRPLALSPDKKLLFAVNTPDSRLEVYRVEPHGLAHRGSIPVGLEPVAVAARTDDEVWVVNHLSDSVSVVKLAQGGWSGQVTRTVLVGDEPRDIVFAGPGKKRAFITTAHRGQNSPIDPALTTPGVGRADVWVFDAEKLGSSLGGDPLSIVTLFADTPRALAVSPDGSRVYAAALHSGNRTTAVNFAALAPFTNKQKPWPFDNVDGAPAPPSSLVVQFDGQHWVDEDGTPWDEGVNFALPDKDVFVIDANASPPQQVPGPGGFFTGVGTTLFNMAVNPVSGRVYVSNTEARNLERFEGPGIYAGHSVRGHFVESRVTVLGPGGAAPRHLNKHIDYGSCCAPAPNAESELSLALPTGMAVSQDGASLYVAALGSSKIGVYATAALEADTFVPNHADQIEVSGGGPTGVVLDDGRHRLYVLTRFDNGISIVDTQSRSEVYHTWMYNPEPPKVVNGRRFLYDARHTSSHGDSACAGCHVFGDMDHLAWDLGNPDDPVVEDPGPFLTGLTDPISQLPFPKVFHPMKGPMTTQSLRGLANHGPMHWRGDRNGGYGGVPSVQPDGGGFDEKAAFVQFQKAFPNLLGRDGEIAPEDMDAFADFALQLVYPPNPIRALDGSLTAEQQEGRDLFMNRKFDGDRCAACHVLDPNANPSAERPGFFGTSGGAAFEGLPQVFKVPHFRNMYQKVGMFGFPALPIADPGDNAFMGDQVRGFGFFHDGSADTILRFLRGLGFSQSELLPDGFPFGAEGDAMRRKIEAFLLAFDSNMAPIVGQQVTLTRDTALAVGQRIELLRARADAGECDLVARLQGPGPDRGFFHLGGGSFHGDRAGQPPTTDAALRALAIATKRSLTYTCTPPGSGVRMGVDRDEDGFLDGDELDAGSDPADPTSTP